MPQVVRFNCPQCGSPLDLRNVRSKSLVCPACHSQIDLTNPQAPQAVGQVSPQRPRSMTPFQIGMQGALEGEPHQIIGRLNYRSDEGDVWDEWLLLSASGRYRWISDSEEEGMTLWDPFTPTTPIDPNTIREGSTLHLGGAPARVGDRGEARIDYIEGEMTWKARLGDRMQYAEAEGPAGRTSIEWTEDEIEFFSGKRLNRAATAQAFGITPQALAASGGGGKNSCLSNAIVLGVVLVMIIVCIVVVSLGPTSGVSGLPSIRSGSPGRSFSGGGGHTGGGK